jgi:hypothetical protein
MPSSAMFETLSTSYCLPTSHFCPLCTSPSCSGMPFLVLKTYSKFLLCVFSSSHFIRADLPAYKHFDALFYSSLTTCTPLGQSFRLTCWACSSTATNVNHPRDHSPCGTAKTIAFWIRPSSKCFLNCPTTVSLSNYSRLASAKLRFTT